MCPRHAQVTIAADMVQKQEAGHPTQLHIVQPQKGHMAMSACVKRAMEVCAHTAMSPFCSCRACSMCTVLTIVAESEVQLDQATDTLLTVTTLQICKAVNSHCYHVGLGATRTCTVCTNVQCNLHMLRSLKSGHCGCCIGQKA